MIWTGARVTLADGKTLLPIEKLQIGQSLFNPLTDQTQEITNILKRNPLRQDGTCPSNLMPHRIAAHAFGKGLPLQDIWLSPAQLILVTGPSPQSHTPRNYRVLRTIAAKETGSASLRAEGCYATIFLETPGTILVEGLPIPTVAWDRSTTCGHAAR